MVTQAELQKRTRELEEKHVEKAEEISKLVTSLQEMHETASQELQQAYDERSMEMTNRQIQLKIRLFAEKILKVAEKVQRLAWIRWGYAVETNDSLVLEVRSVKIDHFERTLFERFMRKIYLSWRRYVFNDLKEEKRLIQKQLEDKLKLSRFLANFNFRKHVKIVRQWRQNVVDIFELRKARENQMQRILRFIKLFRMRKRWATWNGSYEALKNLNFARELFGKQIIKCYKNILNRALMQLKHNVATVREFLAFAEMERRQKEKEARRLHELKLLADAAQKQQKVASGVVSPKNDASATSKAATKTRKNKSKVLERNRWLLGKLRGAVP